MSSACQSKAAGSKPAARSGVGGVTKAANSCPSSQTTGASSTTKASTVKANSTAAPNAGPAKSMRVLGKENEDLQQHVRELSELLKHSQESKASLSASHEVFPIFFHNFKFQALLIFTL
jgi:hypothetical protein